MTGHERIGISLEETERKAKDYDKLKGLLEDIVEEVDADIRYSGGSDLARGIDELVRNSGIDI